MRVFAMGTGVTTRALAALALVWGTAACDDGGETSAPAPDTAVTADTSEPEDSTAAPDTTVEEDTAAPDTSVEADTTPPEDTVVPPEHGFQLVTPAITVPAATEETYCYYFTIPLEEAAGVKRWSSSMTAGSHHMIMYFTPQAEKPDGTIEPNCDGFGSGSVTNVPIWTYSAQSREAEAVMPEGVGMRVGAMQHGFVQMHYLNPTLEELDVTVTINAETFAPGETFMQAQPYITYHTGINIPAGVGQEASAEGTCRVREGLNFFTMSTHSHKRSVKTEVFDGDQLIFTSDDWEHPGAIDWTEGYTFSGDLTYRCDFVNDRDNAVRTGQSADADEMCMAVGYFYPAQRPVFCINNQIVMQ